MGIIRKFFELRDCVRQVYRGKSCRRGLLVLFTCKKMTLMIELIHYRFFVL